MELSCLIHEKHLKIESSKAGARTSSFSVYIYTYKSARPFCVCPFHDMIKHDRISVMAPIAIALLFLRCTRFWLTAMTATTVVYDIMVVMFSIIVVVVLAC